MPVHFAYFDAAIDCIEYDLKRYGNLVDPGHWQGVPTEGKPDLMTQELIDVKFAVPCPNNLDQLNADIGPNQPWADLEFEERVGGEPHNPHHSLEHWPWWHGQAEQTLTYSRHHAPGQFTHTYSERFWPKQANGGLNMGDGVPFDGYSSWNNRGVRYEYGDLNDVVDLLLREPTTRQAHLPIFHPEDTGAVHGGRIPCTLGYQFLMRNNKLHMWYFIRSCDFVRHFRDDLYLACRLLLWVVEELQRRDQPPGYQDHHEFTDPPLSLWDEVTPGTLTFVCCSLHYHRGDEHLVKQG